MKRIALAFAALVMSAGLLASNSYAQSSTDNLKSAIAADKAAVAAAQKSGDKAALKAAKTKLKSDQLAFKNAKVKKAPKAKTKKKTA